MDGEFNCTRCGHVLTMYEYKNYVCLCTSCRNGLRYKEEYNQDVIWNDFNNIDEILERKRINRKDDV